MKKNIKNYASYPDEIQEIVKSRPEFQGKIKETSKIASFVSNVVLFSVILFAFGIFIEADGFLYNFLNILIMGEVLDAFDFLCIDLLWWRHSKRIRFTGTEDKKELYLSPKKHFYAFLRGAGAFLCVALIDGFILSLIH